MSAPTPKATQAKAESLIRAAQACGLRIYGISEAARGRVLLITSQDIVESPEELGEARAADDGTVAQRIAAMAKGET